MGRLGQLFIIIRHEQPGQVVAPGGGIQQIGRQRRVEHEALGRQPLLQQGAHHVLDVVAHLFDVGGEQRRQQAVPIACVAVYIKFHRQRAVLPCLTFHHQGGQIRQAVHGDVLRRPPQRQTLLRPVRVRQYLRRGGVLPVRLGLMARRQVVLVDELLKLQPQKYIVQLRLEGLSQRVRRVEDHGHIGDDGGHPVAVTGRRLAVLEFT